MDNSYDRQAKTAKKVRYVISISLGLIGLFIILTQTVPLLKSYTNGYLLDLKSNSLKQPIPEHQKQQIIESSFYDPGKSYFQNLLSQSGLSAQDGETFFDIETNTLKTVTIDENYSKGMNISIDSVGISSLHITPNVNSYDENTYDKSLKNGAAHFKGTPLPGDGGNSFIYGHSTVESFFSTNKNDPEVAFTKLENVNFGDKISIEKDNVVYYYSVKQIKKVPANDFSVLDGKNNKETLTLMTCWPLGIGSERLIVIADRYE